LNQIIAFPNHKNIKLLIKREDLLHPFVSGNKFRKLKYNLAHAKTIKKDTLITFGGAFSNHIAAVAFAGKENGFKTIGIIRGEELEHHIEKNPTLQFAKNCGMQLQFVTRELYRNKTQIALDSNFATAYIIPEGGTNDLAVKGCEEILTLDDKQFDYVCCAVGTAGTISGLLNSCGTAQKILGFPALKGDFLQDEICKFAPINQLKLITDYHLGGYTKINTELIHFINQFYLDYKIPLDPIYTGKMLYGLIDLIKKDFFEENATILAIHTGGLQAVAGMNQKLKAKKLPILKIDV
jgi:1-aminocyclopropane-1-carboxylate deaminase